MSDNGQWKPAVIPPWDGKTELSVIIPFANEGQNVVFTTQSLIEDLWGFCKFEIVLVDNQSDWYLSYSIPNERLSLAQKEEQRLGIEVQTLEGLRALGVHDSERLMELLRKGQIPNVTLRTGQERPYRIRSRAFFQAPPESKKAGEKIHTMFFRKGVVKYVQYDAKQSHWNAKNAGIANSKGKYLLFLDAHCIMSRDGVRHMVQFLRDPPEEKIGGVHAYINYMLDSRSLEYRPQKDKFFGYQFCTHQSEEYYENGVRKLRFPTKPYKVCVMSTCGMMSPRSVIAELGGWHPEFGSYCGGEGYMNFKQSTCGYHHWIHPKAICWHWAEKRGYAWAHGDYVRNEQIAAYVCGGERALQFCINGRGGNPGILKLAEDVREKCKGERDFIEARQVEDLEDYFDRWVATPGVWK